jgi:hypothetical protein
MEGGLLISHRHHSYHHAGFVTNFAIFTGWCDPLFNKLTLLPGFGPTSHVWPFLLLTLLLAPWPAVQFQWGTKACGALNRVSIQMGNSVPATSRCLLSLRKAWRLQGQQFHVL